MRLGNRLLVLLLLSCLVQAQEQWFLRGRDGKWLSFPNKTEWKREADAVLPLETAMVNKTPEAILVRYDLQSESGDWSIINEYRAHPDGSVASLKRTIVSESQKLQLISVYSKASRGNMKLIHSTEISLTTGDKSKKRVEVPELPIVETVYDLEFLAAERYKPK